MFNGHVLREVHEHYDADGNRTGHTVVTREPEWDAESRDMAISLFERAASICGCGCGQPIVEATQEGRGFRIQETRCLARKALETHAKKQRELAEAKQWPDDWDSGLTYYIDESYGPGEQGGSRG